MPNIPEMSAVWSSWGSAMTLISQGTQTPADALKAAAEQIRTAIGQ
jgi:maltose-binding protein MalE